MCPQAVLWCHHHPRGWRSWKSKHSEWKSTSRVRTVPFPWQTSCLCQPLQVLSFSPSAQSYSGGSAPACWGRGNINIIKIIREVFYKALGVWCVILGGRGGAWLALQGDTSQSVLGFVAEVGRWWILLCTVVLLPGGTHEHHWKFPLGMLLKRGNTTRKKSLFFP